jgi:hypothetical protein
VNELLLHTTQSGLDSPFHVIGDLRNRRYERRCLGTERGLVLLCVFFQERLRVLIELAGKFLDLTREISHGQRLQRHVAELRWDETHLPWQEDEIAPAAGACPTRSTDTVDVLFSAAGYADLDDASDARIVDSTRRYVGRNQNGGSRLLLPKSIRGPSAIHLRFLGMDLVDPCHPT